MSGPNNSSSSPERATWWQAALMIRGETEADQRNIRSIWVWTFVWSASFIAAVMAPVIFPQLERPVTWLLAAVPILVGVPAVGSILRFLREADEFMRKVQLEGIAMGFGAGAIFCMGYLVFERAGAPQLPMAVALVPMTLGWCIGSFIVAARHR
jgi:hypothetical protein